MPIRRCTVLSSSRVVPSHGNRFAVSDVLYLNASTLRNEGSNCSQKLYIWIGHPHLPTFLPSIEPSDLMLQLSAVLGIVNQLLEDYELFSCPALTALYFNPDIGGGTGFCEIRFSTLSSSKIHDSYLCTCHFCWFVF